MGSFWSSVLSPQSEDNARQQADDAIITAQRNNKEAEDKARRLRSAEFRGRQAEAEAKRNDDFRARQLAKAEAERQKRIAEARENGSLDVDFYIRTRSRFNSMNPREYECHMNQIVHDCDDIRLDCCITESLEEFIRTCGRFIVNGNKVQVKYLTPYHGTDRVFGYFKCCGCGKHWQSAYSWGNIRQECRKCNANVYPYKQCPLEVRTEDVDGRPPHDESRCEKCKILGKSCARHYIIC